MKLQFKIAFVAVIFLSIVDVIYAQEDYNFDPGSRGPNENTYYYKFAELPISNSASGEILTVKLIGGSFFSSAKKTEEMYFANRGGFKGYLTNRHGNLWHNVNIEAYSESSGSIGIYLVMKSSWSHGKVIASVSGANSQNILKSNPPRLINLPSGSKLFSSTDANNKGLQMLENGNLGIGITNPDAPLEIRQKTDPNKDRALVISESGNTQKIYMHLANNTAGQYGFFSLGSKTNLRGNGQVSSFGGDLGIGITNPEAPLEIRQKTDPNKDKALVISESGNTQKIYMHLANNTAGQYGFFSLGSKTNLRGNGQMSSFGGALGIGTTNVGDWKLAVNGKIRAKEIKVETDWADFVFYNDYKLPTLTEVENHIKEKGHLKDIPSAKEVAQNGIYLGEMDAKLLQKIEELTLYTIQQEKSLQSQKEEIEDLKKENELLKTLNSKLLEIQKRLDKLENKKD
ncbi:hypothetical protein [Tenacibaculum sp. M341]|uniref:hypothetical protein n=1 Tax=Tenacibaculum sp. M341 TaxID=2530339 RepID=UPI00104A56DB|nr:hypothetical protein [Tenacibaculum sp. M341]TCI93093.1 hypothetical protein EYW44_05605 [Tenacibaculum sp. M341]